MPKLEVVITLTVTELLELVHAEHREKFRHLGDVTLETTLRFTACPDGTIKDNEFHFAYTPKEEQP